MISAHVSAWKPIGQKARETAWTLSHSFTPDGTLIFDKEFYDSLGGAYYFTISFLDEVGFWRKDKRFWNPAFVMPRRATALCKTLRTQVATLASATWAATSALTKLQDNCATP